MKKLGIAVAMLAAVIVSSQAKAVMVGNPVDVEVFAQIDTTLQLTLTGATSFDFGTVNGNSTNVATAAFTVGNTGGGITETLQVKGTDSANWTCATLAQAAAPDRFALYGMFNTAIPTVVAMFIANNQIPAPAEAYKTSSITLFAGDQTGLSIANAATRNLWIGLHMPTTSTSNARQRVQININAIQP